MSKFHYFYKITNLINNHFYYGIHSTDNLDDGYMGSGTRLHYAYKKYGIENFLKEIIKYFKSREELAEYELEIVNEELIADPNCYNISKGGENWCTINTVSCIDENGNKIRIYKDDFYKNGYKTASSGKPNINKGKGRYVNTEGKIIFVDKNDDLYINLLGYTKLNTFGTNNKTLVKDAQGNIFLVNINDPLYTSGKLVSFWKGRKHKDETKIKMHETFRKIKHLLGEKNSQYGLRWIHNGAEIKHIKKDELEKYLANGWKLGKIEAPLKYKRVWVHNNERNIKTSEKYVLDYLNLGYILGYKTIKGT